MLYEISGSHIITSPLLSYLKTISICSHQFEEGGRGYREQGVNRCNFAEVRKLERETRRRVWWLFEGRGVENLSLSIRWLLVCQGDIVCQKDCIMLFELARISKIFGWVQRIFCFNSSNKLHTTLDKTSTDRTRSCVLADVVVLGKLLVSHEENPSKQLKVKSLKVLLKLMTFRQLYWSIPPLVARRSSEW